MLLENSFSQSYHFLQVELSSYLKCPFVSLYKKIGIKQPTLHVADGALVRFLTSVDLYIHNILITLHQGDKLQNYERNAKPSLAFVVSLLLL